MKRDIEPKKRKVTDLADIDDLNDTYYIPDKLVVSKKEAEELAIKSIQYKNVNYGDGKEFETFDPFEDDTNRSSKSSNSSKSNKSADQEYSWAGTFMPKTELYCRRCRKWINLA